MARNIPSNEKQRTATKTPLHRKTLNKNGRPNKELPRQKKPQKICLLQNISAGDAKGLALRTGRKIVKERTTQVPKNDNE